MKPKSVAQVGYEKYLESNGDLVVWDLLQPSSQKMWDDIAMAILGARSKMSEIEIREEALEKLKNMTPKQAFQLAVDTGIYTPDGKLTKKYGGTD